ncbi:MAG: electron transfer flavoprotein subunit beta/FixA family protein [Planctomycetaceae bacterium]|nr:electron transfer flavoprotein subunit beta/FixA family protein [Planctomycetaceae bacterium]
MRIIVPIKQVPETSKVSMDPVTGTMIREGLEAIVNPLDLYAIEAALALRAKCGGEVVVVSMGPPKAMIALREAVSMGADAAVLLSDKAFAGSDTWATSYVLAAAARKLGACDIIICGERATDGDTGQVGPAIAAWLDLPVVTYVSSIDPADGFMRVRRLVENGHEVLEADTPAVLTVVKEIGDPRLPTLAGKLRAKSLEIPVWAAADLDVDPARLGLAGSPTRVVKIFKPKVSRQCEKLAAGDEALTAVAVERLVHVLRHRELIP